MSTNIEVRPRMGRPPKFTGYVEIIDGLYARPDVAEVFLRVSEEEGVPRTDLLREALDMWVEAVQGKE